MTFRIHLAVMQPPGYVHSQGFLDIARYARHQFRRLGAESTIGKNRLREDSINIVMGAHLGFPAVLKERYACVILNLEQLGEGGASVSQSYLDLLATSAVIDYDDRNLAAYGRAPGDIPIVSFLWAAYLATRPPLPLEERPIDLLFFGSMNERRKALFKRIEACGWNISMFDHPLYGEERDEFIRQSKAVLNCHFYETSRFEQTRVFHTLSLGTPVVSERTMRTLPPAPFEHAVSWFTDDGLEAFFKEEFMTPDWQARTQKQLQAFASTDPLAHWQLAYSYCCALKHENHGGRVQRPWLPDRMNLGSGKDYKLGWLNVGSLDREQPDLLIDLGQPVVLPLQERTRGGGLIRLEANSLDRISAVNFLETVPDFACLMTNLLSLLKEDGELEVEVRYGNSPFDLRDPAQRRALNKSSWLYCTGYFWHLGWFEHRFEIADFRWLDVKLEPCTEEQAQFMKVRLRKVSTTPRERAIARAMQADFGGIPSDLPEDSSLFRAKADPV